MSKKGGGDQITGYRYFFDLLMGICRGAVDQVVAIKVGDLLAWPLTTDDPTPITDNTAFPISSPSLFGGDQKEGGIEGALYVMMGAPTQVVADLIKDRISGAAGGHTFTYSPSGGIGTDETGEVIERREDISDFRGMTTLFYSGTVGSNNPYPKTWKIRTQRARAGWDENGCWYPDTAIIKFPDPITLEADKIRGMNPAHILYQCITDRSWGRGLDRSEMDDAAWTYAANRLYDEGFGLCLRWSKDGDINDFVQQVVNHIAAAIYTDRGTGLTTIRLIRDDYDPASIPLFDYTSGLLSVNTEETGASTVVANEIVVKWHDPIKDEDRQTRVHNLASIQSLGVAVSQMLSYPGIPSLELAQRVALRDLRVGSAGLKRFKIECDRRAWKLPPGSVMRISAPDKGISNMFLRVATYDDGTATGGTIKLDCVQDVFGMPSTIYTSDVPGDWTPPRDVGAAPIVDQAVFEASYYDMARGLSTADFNSIDDTEGGIVAVAGRPSATSLAIALAVTPDGGVQTIVTRTGVYCPSAITRDAVSYYTTTVLIATGNDLDGITAGDAAWFDGEIIQVVSMNLTTGILTFERGCVDTEPQPHLAGAAIFFYNGTKAAHTGEYTLGELVHVKPLNQTQSASEEVTAGINADVTIVAKHVKPYPPGNVKLNGVPGLDTTVTAIGPLATLSWAARNRLTQFDQLVKHSDAAVSAEAGTTYTVEVWDRLGNALIRTHTGISASTYDYTDTEADAGPDPAEIDLVLYSVVGGVRSLADARVSMTYTALSRVGWGNNYDGRYSGLT